MRTGWQRGRDLLRWALADGNRTATGHRGVRQGTWTEATAGPPTHHDNGGTTLIVLGLILAIVGAVIDVPIILTLGIILLVVGVVFVLLGATGRAIGGRKHFF